VRDFKGLRRFRLSGGVFSQLNARIERVKIFDDYLHEAEVNRRPNGKTCADKQESLA
jgi:hypothetical protein